MAVAAQPDLRTTHRHLKVSGHTPAFGFEPCEDPGCVVGTGAVASSCGRLACPDCGCGGTNLSTIQLSHVQLGERIELRLLRPHVDPRARPDLRPEPRRDGRVHLPRPVRARPCQRIARRASAPRPR